VRQIERSTDRERFGNAFLRCSIADHHVYLVSLSAERDLSSRTAPCEALEARATNRAECLEGSAARVEMAAAGHRDSPTDDYDDGTPRRNPVGGDLTLG
jgi:hypothetical protein